MILRPDNLKLGIDWWEKHGWESDYINREYYEMYSARSSGITSEWWSATVKRLWDWLAIRGPMPPNSKAEIMERGLPRLDRIAAEYSKLVKTTNGEPKFTAASWEDVSPLFYCALEIKPMSRVFASKMCHFLFPNLFMVMDNKGTGVFEYEFYWRGMQSEWSRFGQKSEAIEKLRHTIKSEMAIHPLYPYETKIIELCHIGYEHG